MGGVKKTEAISIRKIDYSETSQILHFLTKEYGKISAIAKGSKRSKTTFYGPLDICAHYEIVYIDKRGQTLDILTQVNQIDHFRNIRKQLGVFSAASYIIEFVNFIIAPGQHIPTFFDHVMDALHALNEGGVTSKILIAFELSALRLTGFLPRTTHCVLCNTPVAKLQTRFFSSKAGGALCLSCSRRPKGADAFKIPVSYELLRAFSYLSRHPTYIYQPSCPDEILAGLRKVLTQYISSIMEREPNALKYSYITY